jgi:hypothetical protein
VAKGIFQVDKFKSFAMIVVDGSHSRRDIKPYRQLQIICCDVNVKGSRPRPFSGGHRAHP